MAGTCKKCKCMTTDTRERGIGLCFNCEHGLVYQKKEDEEIPRSTEIDSTQVIREAMIERRNQALSEANFDDAVLFSHVIAALAYCMELEGYDVAKN